MSEFEEIRRRCEHLTEQQLARRRKHVHDKLERIRKAKDRGGTGFDPIRPDPRRLR